MTIVVAGGLGELYSLDIEEHRALVTAAVAGADGKMPVVAGVGGGYRNALSMARNAEQSGADAVLVFPPGSRWGLEEGTYRCCLDVAKAVDIGVLIYPRSEEYWPRLLKRLSRTENIIGFKDPSGDTQVGLALGDLVPEDFLWVAEGEGHAAKTLPVGGRAYTTAVATFVPQASHAFWKHGVAGEKEQMNRVLKDKIEPVVKLRGVQPGVRRERHQGGPGIAGSGRRAGQASGNPGGRERQGGHRRNCPLPFRGETGGLKEVSHEQFEPARMAAGRRRSRTGGGGLWRQKPHQTETHRTPHRGCPRSHLELRPQALSAGRRLHAGRSLGAELYGGEAP